MVGGRKTRELDADMLLFLEKLQYHDPRVEIQVLAEELGLSRAAIYARLNKLKELRRTVGLRMEIEIRNLLIGLGRLLVVARKEFAPDVNSVPGKHWLESYARTLDGKHVLLRYYYVLGSSGHGDLRGQLSLSRKSASKIMSVLDISIMRGNRIRFTRYYNLVEKKMIIPWKDLEARMRSADIEPLYIREKPRYKPNDIVDLVILAYLQNHPFASFRELAKKYATRLNNIKTCFVEHLYKPGVIGGFFGYSFLVDRRERLIAYNILRFVDREAMARFTAATQGRPPIFGYNIPYSSRDNIMVVTVVMPVLEYPRYIKFLDYVVKQGLLESYELYYVAAHPKFVRGFTIPYRNYDPFTQRWILDEKHLDEVTVKFAALLERTGFIKRTRRI